MKNKTKKIILFIFLLLLIAAIAFLFLCPKDKDKTGEENSFVEEIATNDEKEDKKEGEKKSKKESSKSAYDKIIEIMTEPQYWSEDEYFPLYSAEYLEEEARKALVNATGWTLVDAKTATFSRGYKSKLTISFSNHTAVSEDLVSGITYYMDYKNDEYYVDMNGSKNPITLHRDVDGYYNTSFGMLEKTFTYYEEIFQQIGAPLLEKEEGTLESYKKIKAKEYEKADDGLIHAVWEIEGFTFDYINQDLAWIDDYKDIENKNVPQTELKTVSYEHLDGSIEYFDVGSNSPIYLVCADKDSSKVYINKETWFESITSFDNISESFACYYLAPLLKNLYGYDGVYFTKAQNIKGPSNVYQMSTKKEFDKGFDTGYENHHQLILELFPRGDMFVSMAYTYDTDNYDFRHLEDKMRSLYLYYEKDYPYGLDFLGNFLLVYSVEAQSFLGLR